MRAFVNIFRFEVVSKVVQVAFFCAFFLDSATALLMRMFLFFRTLVLMLLLMVVMVMPIKVCAR